VAEWKKILLEGDAVVSNLATATLTQSDTHRIYSLDGDDATLSFKGGETRWINSSNAIEFSADTVNRLFTIHDGNSIRFQSDNINQHVDLKSGTSVSSNYVITLPTSPPGGNNKVLESDSSGNLSWIATPSGGSGGIITDFTNSTNNNIVTASGSTTLNGEDNLTYDGTNLAVVSGGIHLDNNQSLQAKNTNGAARVLAKADSSDVAVFNAGFTQTLIGGSSGITLDGPVTANEIVHVGSGISSAGNVGEGAETTVFGGSGSTSSFAGRTYYYGGAGWVVASQSSEVANANLLGIAMGGNTGVGMCLKGFVKTDVTNLTPGKAAYMNTNATITTTAPSTSGNFSRIIGYAVASDTIFFNPSNEYIELS